jgi:hypothetical protein
MAGIPGKTLLLAAAGAVALGGCATSYSRNSLGWGDGYRERQIAPGVWLVRAQANFYTRDDFAMDMATYRAAAIARDAGFSHVQLLDTYTEDNEEFLGDLAPMAGQRVEVKARGVNDANAPIACEMRPPAACRTLSVAETIRTLGPRLNIRTPPPPARR